MDGAGLLIAGYVVLVILIGALIELWRHPASPRSGRTRLLTRMTWTVMAAAVLVVAAAAAAVLTGLRGIPGPP